TAAAAEDFSRLLTRLTNMFGICARLVVLPHLTTVAAALHCGARVARGDYLLFLAADVVPTRAAWLASMQDVIQKRPRVGAVGARIVSSDGAIHHIGMRWNPQVSLRDSSFPDYPFQGIGEHGVAELENSDVLAVCSSCLLTFARHYWTVDGFDGEFFSV